MECLTNPIPPEVGEAKLVLLLETIEAAREWEALKKRAHEDPAI